MISVLAKRTGAVVQPNQGTNPAGVFLDPTVLCRFKTIGRNVQRNGLSYSSVTGALCPVEPTPSPTPLSSQFRKPFRAAKS